jgi:RNA polymerase sigma-70 factor (ECF subfamily)
MSTTVNGLQAGRPAVNLSGAHGDEAGLLAQLRAGDGRAYEALVRACSGRLLAAARRLLRNEEDARDAVQEAFLLAFRAVDRFEGASSLSTWLHRIAINCALMKIRSRACRPESSIEELLPRFEADGHTTVPYEPWPESGESAVLSAEMRAEVRAAIDRLPETHRMVLLLRDIEELSTEEAAEVLGITPNAVKIRLHRARQALRELLDPAIRSRGSEPGA